MIIFLIIWAIGLNWLAYNRKFYHFPKESLKDTPYVYFFELLFVFGIYIGAQYFGLPLIAIFFRFLIHQISPESTSLPIILITFLQCAVMATILSLFVWFFRRPGHNILSKLWKNQNHPINVSKGADFGVGVFTWFLSFPAVTLLSEAIDALMKTLFDLKHQEQAAVKYVKLAMSQPASLIFALVVVLVFAPIIEEFLFRGALQTYLKKRIGVKAAILLSSLCFALFHFSPSQGLSNASLVIALFFLGCFLGFLYQRQGSLWAPIGLHFCFNAISALRIIFFPEVL